MTNRRGGTQYAKSRAFRGFREEHRRHVRGDRAFRRFLKNMPEAMKDEMIVLLGEVGEEVAAAQRADAPGRRLRAAISSRVSRGTMRLRVGLIGRPINRRLFFARILEGGRKSQFVAVRRRGNRPYTMKVRAMRARPFVNKQRPLLRMAISKRLHRFWNGVIAIADQGVTDE